MNTKHQVFEEQSSVEYRNQPEEVQSSSIVKRAQVYQSAKKMTIISKLIGYIGILVGVVSLFFYPYILGVIGIILGFISMKLGEIVLSSWAIGICALSIILSVFVVPATL